MTWKISNKVKVYIIMTYNDTVYGMKIQFQEDPDNKN